MSSSPPRAPRDSLLGTLDHALRGGFLAQQDLAAGRVDLPVRRLCVLTLLLAAIYGVCLGSYGLFRGADSAWLQVVTNAWKLPLLFVLTLVVTFPSLYVFSALQRLPLDFGSTLRVMLLAILAHVAIAASLGPVFVFFTASTTSYPFLLLLNVAFFGLGGVLGLMVLRRATASGHEAGVAPAPPTGEQDPPPLRRFDPARHQVRRVLGAWCIVYGIVGAQMSWLLRPFLGSPDQPFSLFRPRESNWLTGVLHTIADLFRQ